MSTNQTRSEPIPAPAPLTAAIAVAFRAMAAEDRRIVPMEAETTAVPFAIRRVFTIRATRAGLVGGRHAHHRCHQLLVALEGRCVVRVVGDRADLHAEFTLDDPASGLWIPPGLWAEQRYETDPMVLMVLCDRAYEADDYIRDFAAYLAYRSA